MMTESQAQTAVTGSALVVALIFAYRKLVEPAASASGSSTRTAAPNTGHFVIGFGFTYLTLAILAQAAPQLGGMGAILVATADVITNGQAVLKDFSGQLGTVSKATGSNAASSSSVDYTPIVGDPATSSSGAAASDSPVGLAQPSGTAASSGQLAARQSGSPVGFAQP
jgi:hypothetical protein